MTAIETAKLDDADPRACLADVLARINNHTASRLEVEDVAPPVA